MIIMDNLRRYGGALGVAAVPTLGGLFLNEFFRHVAQGSMPYLNQAADTMGAACAIVGLGLGIVGGVRYVMNYNQANQQQNQGGAQQAGNQQAGAQQGGQQGTPNVVVNIYNRDP